MKIINNQLYLEIAELESFGISKKTVYNGLSFNNRGKTGSWSNTKTEDIKSYLILYDSIPVNSRKKLPPKSELLTNFLNEKKKESELIEEAKKLQA